MRKVQLNIVTSGMVVFVLAAIIGLAVVRATVMAPSRPQEGARLFQEKGCSQCHFTANRKTKVGPGLKGLFYRPDLPVSGRPVTGENVREQLIDPYRNMPAYNDRLAEAQRRAIVDYLKTLLVSAKAPFFFLYGLSRGRLPGLPNLTGSPVDIQ